MQKVVGLNPIVSIVVLLIGFKVGGMIGGILAIPVATAIGVFARDILDNRLATKK
jgi:predicted PurR-regulated permease PerM